MTTTGYCIDTMIVIDARNTWYPPDVFPGLWQGVGQLAATGRVVMPREVLTELERGDDDCKAWAKSIAGLVVEADSAVLAAVTEIARDFPEWSSVQVNWADPFVIAHARVRGFAAVTHERLTNSAAPQNQKSRVNR